MTSFSHSRRLALALSLAALAAPSGLLAQGALPKAITLVVPQAAGGSSPSELMALTRAEMDKWAPVVKESGMKVD